jgi:hypothetical protein
MLLCIPIGNYFLFYKFLFLFLFLFYFLGNIWESTKNKITRLITEIVKIL